MPVLGSITEVSKMGSSVALKKGAERVMTGLPPFIATVAMVPLGGWPDRDRALEVVWREPPSMAECERLIDLIRDRERAGGELLQLEIPHAESRLVARLHELAEVHDLRNNDEGVIVSAWIPKDALHLFEPYRQRARSRSNDAA